MKTGAYSGILMLLVLAAVFLFSAAYTVAEYEQILVTQFGKPIGDAISEAGLHWRIPFVQRIHRFEKRLLEHDGDATEIPTRDKKFIHIDTFARWRIVDPLLFYQSMRDEILAKTRLDDIIDSETRDAISSHFLIEAVRNSNRKLVEDAEIAEASSSLEDLPALLDREAGKRPAEPGKEGEEQTVGAEPSTIERGREAITREILESAARKIKNFGIELVDVQIKSINYVPRVQERVFERMVSEREQIAEKYRAEGQKIYAEVQGRIEKERNRILSEAYRQAETIKGEGEAEAAKIYAEAYGRDPEFYAFWKSLEIYRENLAGNVSLIISTDSDFFRYLRSAGLSPAAPKE